MSYYNLFSHIFFATRFRHPSIELRNERRVYYLLMHIMEKYDAFVIRIGGMPDHVHLLISLPGTMSLSKFVQNVKRESSLAISNSNILEKWEGWQEGYGCFTHNYKDIEIVKNYIIHQKAHHLNQTFEDEYANWLKENGIDSDS